MTLSRIPKILILTASFGDGHNAAAFSLADVLHQIEPETQVELLDLFDCAYGNINKLFKSGYRGIVRYAPALWSKCFGLFDNAQVFDRQMLRLGRVRQVLTTTLDRTSPHVVISTYPVYGHLLAQIFPDGAKRPFRFFTVITDSISVCSAWYRAPSDIFLVANQPTAAVLARAGVGSDQIMDLGFPVSPAFVLKRPSPLAAPRINEAKNILYVINTGKALAGPSLEKLLTVDALFVTITTGRNATLQRRLTRRLQFYGSRVQVMGWTNEMPRLLMSHHLLISKAGGAIVQEAIAACCPILVNQVIPGQEEGNARLIQQLGVGTVESNQKVPALVERIFANNGRLWEMWRNNLQTASRPESSFRIAELILHECRLALSRQGNGRQPRIPNQALEPNMV